MASHPKSETQTPGCPTPSPVNPVPAKIPVEEHHSHRHVLQLSLIVMVCMVGVMMFLCTVSLLIKFFYTRRYIRNHNRRRDAHAPILFDLNGDHDDDVEAQEVEVVHPIWHIRTVGLQQSLIDSITVFKYNKHEAGIIDGTECSVCLGEFEHDDTLRLLPKCSHAFHIPCIDTWLTSHKNCPLCRAPVVRDETLVRPTVDHTASNVSDHQSADAVSSAVEVEEETQPLRRSLSMDSTSANNSMLSFRDVVLDLDDDDSSGKDMNMSIEKHASTSTTINNKLGSIGRGLQQKRAGSMRRSFSQNTKFLFPRHSRSQSSTLPL